MGGHRQTGRQKQMDKEPERSIVIDPRTMEEKSRKLGKGQRERENIPMFPFLSAPLTTPGSELSGRRGWPWGLKPRPLGIGS